MNTRINLMKRCCLQAENGQRITDTDDALKARVTHLLILVPRVHQLLNQDQEDVYLSLSARHFSIYYLRGERNEKSPIFVSLSEGSRLIFIVVKLGITEVHFPHLKNGTRIQNGNINRQL